MANFSLLQLVRAKSDKANVKNIKKVREILLFNTKQKSVNYFHPQINSRMNTLLGTLEYSDFSDFLVFPIFRSSDFPIFQFFRFLDFQILF